MTHDEALVAAARLLRDGRELLGRAAAVLRGPDVGPDPRAMRAEAVLTRAIESLGSLELP